MHYYKRNLGDYAKKAGRLSMLQHGSYTLLIDACYDREQFPTRDEAIEWTWASTKEEVEAVEFVLSRFFTLEDGRYVQKRIQEEIAEYRAKAEKNRRIAIERETNRKTNSTKRTRASHEAPPNQEPLTTNQEPIQKTTVAPSAPVVPSEAPPDAVVQVFRHWQQAMDSPRSQLDDKRRRAIKAALKFGYTAEQLCVAIDGCRKSPWHMGQNDRGTKYNGLGLILRGADYIDKFIAAAHSDPPPRPGRPSINDLPPPGAEDDVFSQLSTTLP